MKYRKKPVVINAIQWTANNNSWEEIKKEFGDNTGILWNIPSETLVIPTLEGDMVANKNDWIIQGVNGELYPCKPDIFEKTYEKVVE
jgi:hypothetical protein